MIESQIKDTVRTIPDFPKEGIMFKDITPILKDHLLCEQIVAEFCDRLAGRQIDVVAGIESRGFLFGMLIAQKLRVPFVPIRKKGKLPAHTIQETYLLEYGEATIEMHFDAIRKGDKVLIHDDLLATGGTVLAASKLIQQLGGEITAFSFLIGLSFLNAEEKIRTFSDKIIILADY